MSLWDYECTVSRRARRQGSRGWTRRIIVQGVPSAEVYDLIPWEFSAWPQECGPGNVWEVLVDVDVDADFVVKTGGNLARVILYYRPRTPLELMIYYADRGYMLSGRSSLDACRMRVWGPDDNGNWITIEGQDPTDLTGKTSWKIEQGSNIAQVRYPIHSIEAVVSAGKFDSMVGGAMVRVGGYNDRAVHGFQGGVGAWLLVGVTTRPMNATTIGQALSRVRYDIAMNLNPMCEQGWASLCWSRKFVVQVREVPFYDQYGNQQGFREVSMQVPTDVKRWSRMIFPSNWPQVIEPLLMNRLW